MCADSKNLESTLRIHEQAGIDYIHIDVMDGNFVPNFTFGPDFCKVLRTITKIPLDIHLMINRPEQYQDILDLQEGEICAIHQESTNHLQRILSQIQSKGARAAVAINPSTSIYSIEEVLDDVNLVLYENFRPLIPTEVCSAVCVFVEQVRAAFRGCAKARKEVSMKKIICIIICMAMWILAGCGAVPDIWNPAPPEESEVSTPIEEPIKELLVSSDTIMVERQGNETTIYDLISGESYFLVTKKVIVKKTAQQLVGNTLHDTDSIRICQLHGVIAILVKGINELYLM